MTDKMVTWVRVTFLDRDNNLEIPARIRLDAIKGLRAGLTPCILLAETWEQISDQCVGAIFAAMRDRGWAVGTQGKSTDIEDMWRQLCDWQTQTDASGESRK